MDHQVDRKVVLPIARGARFAVLVMLMHLLFACAEQREAPGASDAEDANAEDSVAAGEPVVDDADNAPVAPPNEVPVAAEVGAEGDAGVDADTQADADSTADGAAPEGVAPYEIDCSSGECLVDKATYVGWRTYHAECHVCHAQDAVGSSFAPSLIDRLQQIDEARFVASVTNGYTGQVGVMPAWGENPNVNRKIPDLYAYLKARSDGVLGPGRPTRKR